MKKVTGISGKIKILGKRKKLKRLMTNLIRQNTVEQKVKPKDICPPQILKKKRDDEKKKSHRNLKIALEGVCRFKRK